MRIKIECNKLTGFTSTMQERKTPIALFLNNGHRLIGIAIGFDMLF